MPNRILGLVHPVVLCECCDFGAEAGAYGFQEFCDRVSRALI
jgi:hypothetical protein